MRTSLQKGEKILLVTHASWTILVLPAIIAAGLIAASFLVGFINHYGWIAAVLGLLYFLLRYASWSANIWVVTNFRVIDEVGLFNHFAKESPLDKINNVSYSHSLLGRIFNYGDVVIQTAAQVGATTYVNVSHPKLLQETISGAQAEYKTWEYGNQARQMAAVLDNRSTYNSGNSTAGAGTPPPQVAAELEKLFELKMKGAISEEEYIRAKNRLLNH